MRGEFIGVWSETGREIWLPLIDHYSVPEDIFCELYRALAAALIRRIATSTSRCREGRRRQRGDPCNYLICKRLSTTRLQSTGRWLQFRSNSGPIRRRRSGAPPYDNPDH